MRKIKLSKRTKAMIKATALIATGTAISTLTDQLESKNDTISTLTSQIENLKDVVVMDLDQISKLKESLYDVELLSESVCW